MKKIFTILVLFILLTSCSSFFNKKGEETSGKGGLELNSDNSLKGGVEPNEEKSSFNKEIVYENEKKEKIAVSFGDDKVKFAYNGKLFELKRTISASGMMYEDKENNILFASKGDFMFIEIDEKIVYEGNEVKVEKETSINATKLEKSFKGFEFYSWEDKEKGEWKFSVLMGTNRMKTCEEVKKASVLGVEEGKKLIENKTGIFIFENELDDCFFVKPPKELQDIIEKNNKLSSAEVN